MPPETATDDDFDTVIVAAQEAFHADTRPTSPQAHRWIEAKKARGSRKAAPVAPPAPAPKPLKDVLNATGQPRLGKGGLEALVLKHMAEHPEVEFTSTELSHKLSRSNGAIQNALEKFTEQGKVVRTSERPRRYRYANGKAAPRTTRRKKAA